MHSLTTDQKREYLHLLLKDGPEVARAYLDFITKPAFSIGIGPKLRFGNCDCEHTFKSLEDAIDFMGKNNLKWPTEICVETNTEAD